MDPRRITELYDLYVAGSLPSDDARWNEVEAELLSIAESVVRRSARNVHGPALTDAIEDVHSALLQKFIRRRLSRIGPDLKGLLRMAARNEMTSSFRRRKSPSTVGFAGAERTWKATSDVATDAPDIFAEVRARFDEFRFPTHGYARDGILAFFLSNTDYPGEQYLEGFGVDNRERKDVYNAALFDINSATMAMVNPE